MAKCWARLATFVIAPKVTNEMSVRILWADDEIDLLKPHIIFLQEKGYEVETVTNGEDAVDAVQESHFDIIFLDENMPGLSGLETLERIKSSFPSVPIIMITKSEEESIMEDAIGKKISDYLIKPVNPKQILLSVKKNLDTKRLVGEQTTSNYQREFRQIGLRLSERLDTNDWKEVYKNLVYWEMELENTDDESMAEILQMQKTEANSQFCKFVANNYYDWVANSREDIPLMSHNVIKDRVVPHMEQGPLFLVVIDNLRYDQWRTIRPILRERFNIEEEDLYYSILPTATQYARNALFAGLLPSEIEKKHPSLWLNDEDEGGKNQHEEVFLNSNMQRLGKNISTSYNKITNLNAGRKLVENFNNLLNNDLNVIVYNFVDMLSHARTDMEVIRELADDEPAYRSLTESWFEHSPLLDIFEKIADNHGRVMVTTDHGTIRVFDSSKVVGDRNTTTNLRYKAGRNLNYTDKEVFAVVKPELAYLPRPHISTAYIFATENRFFVYPNNMNKFVNLYRNTFQHGGVSMEEMIVPFAYLKAK